MLISQYNKFKFKHAGKEQHCQVAVMISKGVVIIVATQPIREDGTYASSRGLIGSKLSLLKELERKSIRTNYMYIRIPPNIVNDNERVFELSNEGKLRRVGAIEMIERYFNISIPEWRQ